MARPSIATPRIAPQRFALPSARTFAGAAHRMPNVMRGNQMNRAFAFAGAGAGAAVASHMLRNPFFANRHGVTPATFRGQLARHPFWHHRHFRPIVIGWFGPLFWPYGYDDFLDYAFYPYAYDAFWPYAYDDVYDGMFGLYDSGIRAAYSATGRTLPPSGSRRIVGGTICSGQTAGLTDWQIDQIAEAVTPDDAQRAALDELKAASGRTLEILKSACPSELASTPTGRIQDMQRRLSTMLEAVRAVRAPLTKFYDLLTDEQKARFNALGAGEDQNEAQARRDLTQACSERAAGIAAIPIERVERTVRPDDTQRTALAELQSAVVQAGELLQSNCPTYRPLTPVVRLDAMEQRLDAMLRAVETVQPALSKFYGSLSDEQKERFNRLPPAQG
jgi:ABC-type transporter MlaC component